MHGNESTLILCQVLDRRDIWRQDKLDRLVRNNHLHCNLKPIYGSDVLKALTLPTKVRDDGLYTLAILRFSTNLTVTSSNVAN